MSVFGRSISRQDKPHLTALTISEGIRAGREGGEEGRDGERREGFGAEGLCKVFRLLMRIQAQFIESLCGLFQSCMTVRL